MLQTVSILLKLHIYYQNKRNLQALLCTKFRFCLVHFQITTPCNQNQLYKFDGSIKTLVRVYNVKIRSGANKSKIIYLLGENYGERRRAYFESEVGLWESEIKANKETIQWGQEIDEEESVRKPLEPARPRLTKGASNGSVQRWFVDGR